MNVFLGYLVAVNALTFIAMLIDKLQASNGSRRIPERFLFFLTLIGGSAAMLLSMYTLRHKNRKLSFQMVAWLLLLMHLALAFSR